LQFQQQSLAIPGLLSPYLLLTQNPNRRSGKGLYVDNMMIYAYVISYFINYQGKGKFIFLRNSSQGFIIPAKPLELLLFLKGICSTDARRLFSPNVRYF